MNGFLSLSGIYVLSNIVNAIIPFLLLPILTRYLTTEEYGQVAMFQLVVAGVSAIIGLSVQGAASRKYYDECMSKKELSIFNGSCVQILSSSGLFFLFLVFIFGGEISLFFSIPQKWQYYSVIIAFSFFIIELRLSQWQIRNQAIKFSALQIGRSLLNTLFSLLFVVVLIHGSSGRIEAILYCSLIFMIVSAFLLYKDDLISLTCWHPIYLKEALSYGVPLVPHILGAFLLMSIDRFVINQELGLAQTGIFMVAVQFSLALTIVFEAINRAYVPWLFECLKRNIQSEKIKVVKYTYLYFLLLFLISGLSFTIGPFFVVLIAGDKYKESADIIGWLCLAQCIRGAYLMVTNYIFYAKKTNVLSMVTISTGIINIILLYALVNRYGVVGACYASVFSMSILFLCTWFFANKKHPMPWLVKNTA